MVLSSRLRRTMLRGVSYMAGGVTVLGVGQAAKLRWQYECPDEPTGRRHGHAGAAFQGKPLRLLFVGDSIAVGVGAKVAAPLQAACAARLANLQRRPVEWRTIAANGADVRELNQLLDAPGAPSGEAQVVDLGFDIAERWQEILCRTLAFTLSRGSDDIVQHLKEGGTSWCHHCAQFTGSRGGAPFPVVAYVSSSGCSF